MKLVALLLSLMVCISVGCNRQTESSTTSDTNSDTPNSNTVEDTTDSKLTTTPNNTDDLRLQEYFERYCDYTGGMGIGFVASHTYDFKFRQHLKKTDDKELKRLFVLQHLYRDLDFAVRDYEEGQIRIGKVEYRQMTGEEKTAAKKRILEMLDDLEKFDPNDPEREIAETRAKLN